jgi:chromosome segregation ATPase
MGKLPTTFTTLDLTGFDIDQTKQYTSITREMVDIACAVLQKNRVGVVTRSVQAALKHIFGIGGSADTICQLLREWRSENMASLKQGKGEKDLISAILEATDDGLLEETDIPEDYLIASRQMAIATYRLAYQNADTSVSGDRMKQLAVDNQLMRQQLTDFPKLEFELNFYKGECERQREELREAYMNLNKQKLAEAEEFRRQIDSLHQERNDLVAKLSLAEQRLTEIAVLEQKVKDLEQSLVNAQLSIETKNQRLSELETQHQSNAKKNGKFPVASSI